MRVVPLVIGLLLAGYLCFGHAGYALVFVVICGLLWQIKNRRWRMLVAGVFCLYVAASAVDWLIDRKWSVQRRICMFPFNTAAIVDIQRSPSGESVAYVIQDAWIDVGYSVLIKDRRGFLQGRYEVTPGLTDAAYPQDIRGSWRGPQFVIRTGIDLFTYDEHTGAITLQAQ